VVTFFSDVSLMAMRRICAAHGGQQTRQRPNKRAQGEPARQTTKDRPAADWLKKNCPTAAGRSLLVADTADRVTGSPFAMASLISVSSQFLTLEPPVNPSLTKTTNLPLFTKAFAQLQPNPCRHPPRQIAS
jgi:hypothetical protein